MSFLFSFFQIIVWEQTYSWHCGNGSTLLSAGSAHVSCSLAWGHPAECKACFHLMGSPEINCTKTTTLNICLCFHSDFYFKIFGGNISLSLIRICFIIFQMLQTGGCQKTIPRKAPNPKFQARDTCEIRQEEENHQQYDHQHMSVPLANLSGKKYRQGS